MYKMHVHRYDLSDNTAEQLVPHHHMIFLSKDDVRKFAEYLVTDNRPPLVLPNI